MPRTFQKYLDLIAHAVGPTPAVGFDALEVLNDAGCALFGEARWSWLKVGPVTAAAVAGQDFIDLPANFGELVEAVIDNTVSTGSYSRLRLVQVDEIIRLKQRSFVPTTFGELYVAFDTWRPQQSAAVEPTPRAYLYPRPTVNGDPTITYEYRKRWVPATAGTLNNAPDMPREFEHALVLLSRAMAENLEHQQEALEEKIYRDRVEKLKAVDARRQPSVGLVRANLPAAGGGGGEVYEFGTMFLTE